MSEPTFIKSSEPFKVAMPEGSTVARSQKAKVGDDVRRVLADDEFVNVEDTHSDNVQSGASGGIKKDRFVHGDSSISQNSARLQSSGGLKNNVQSGASGGLKNSSFVTGAGASSSRSQTQTSKLNSPEAQAAALAADSKEEERLAMLEMNFPARIVHLKIENDTIREQLNELNAQIKPGRK
jgi:hypothetical protein